MLEAKWSKAGKFNNQENEQILKDLENDKVMADQAIGRDWKGFLELYNESTKGWKKKYTGTQKHFDKEGWKCDVWQRKQKGMKQDILRIDSVLKDIDIDKLYTMYTRSEANPELGIKESYIHKEFKDEEETIVVYTRFAMPLMSDRDTLGQMKKLPADGNGYYMLGCSINDETKPPIPGVVRAFYQSNVWIRPDPSDEHQFLYTEFTVFDMKGKMPSFL
jgi:hypothetical protein